MAKGKNGRIHLLDEIRGFAIICMVFYHAFLTASEIFGSALGAQLEAFFRPAVAYFAAAFIVISGISCNLSHSNRNRGLILAAVSAALTLVTWALKFVGIYAPIWFGILHLLSFSILFVALFARALNLIHPLIGIPLNALLFYVTYNISNGWLNLFVSKPMLPNVFYSTDWLCPLGLHTTGFYSADYFPILPWLFMFLCGYYLGIYAKKGRFPKFCYNQHIRPFSFVGRYTLWIYLFHQPVIYGLFWVVSLIKSHI